MKKYILIVLGLFLVFVGVYITSDTLEESNNKVIEETKNYKVVASENEKSREYQYLIFDNDGDVIYEGSHYKTPNLSYLSNNIVQSHTGGGNISQYQFFDIEKGLVSQIYENPGLIDDGKIVYMVFENNKIKLIVRDLFDKSKLYKEYERDFSPVAAAYNDLIKAEFIDSNKLQVTYLSGENFIEVTEILDLK